MTALAPPPIPEVEGIRHRFVEVAGLRLHVAEAGEGDPVILLHTVFQHWYAWRHVVARLAPHHRTICPDLRGCGWSDAPPDGYEKEVLAADVVNLMDALGLRRAHLVGHSLGGFVAFLVALRHPERVDRMLAVGVTHPWPTYRSLLSRPQRTWYQWLVASPVLGPWAVANRRELTRWILRGTSPRPQAWPDHVIDAFARPLADPARARAVARIYRTLLGRELPAILRGRYRSLTLQPPALLLLGSRDYFFAPSSLRGYEPYAPNLGVEVLPGVGHFVPEEDPDLFSERAVAFLGATA